MKELKTFFNNDNRLNKGYAYRNINRRQPDNVFYRKKYEHILPPIDVISQYEEINPGTLAQLIDMASLEQNHRHSIDLVTIEGYNRAVKLGRISSLIFVMLICITTILLSATSSALTALIFSGFAFVSLGVASFISNRHCEKGDPNKAPL